MYKTKKNFNEIVIFKIVDLFESPVIINDYYDYDETIVANKIIY